jgi:hypothetical protein
MKLKFYHIAVLLLTTATLHAQVSYQLVVREGEGQPGGLIFTDLESAPRSTMPVKSSFVGPLGVRPKVCG